MKRFFSSILLILLLAGCSGNSVSSLSFSDNSSVNISESSESSDILSSEDDSSSISSSSNDGSSSSSSDSSSISSSSSSSVSSSSSETEIDLGLRSISWVRDYIKTAPITVNSHDIGVNMLEKVTIKGLALDRRDLVKTKSSFGLNISSPKKFCWVIVVV